ncbi:DNA-binding nuclear phosphoprotein p8 domain-containing protein [Ditylenchus destructor]|uniref:DNA-binding nuclear phosphoprotein p8 domain-containing protein n=1 Tax=Ditylenchus destructor TaxID=166010 RepID=A0AAD4MYP5_9BILA|nr:DNA-binding nuclear phosphoprotein p8 domain-containing protein [Ditylenchus destructor]
MSRHGNENFAEQLAEEFEYGRCDVKFSGSGKNRTKSEMAESKNPLPGGTKLAHKLVQNWRNNERNN